MRNSTLGHNPVVRTTIVCIGIYVLLLGLHQAKAFVTPLLFATIFAILLDGVVVFAVNKLRFPRTPAICIVLVLAMALAAGLILLIGYQGTSFLEDLPKLADRIGKVANDVTHWVAEQTGIADKRIDQLFEETKDKQISKSSVLVGQTLNSAGDVLAVLFLMPVYVFMLLFYKDHLLEFLKKRLFDPARHQNLQEILSGVKTLIRFYLLGLITEIFIVSALNALGLFIIGVEYAILLGLISGVMNLIPYIGGLISGSLAVIVAVSSPTPLDAVWVVASYSLVQFIDNTFVVPLIVGSRVKLNAFVSLVGVVAGGALWGIAGMILSIPVLGVLKIAFDKTAGMEPWGFLLGERDTDEPRRKVSLKQIRFRKKGAPPA